MRKKHVIITRTDLHTRSMRNARHSIPSLLWVSLTVGTVFVPCTNFFFCDRAWRRLCFGMQFFFLCTHRIQDYLSHVLLERLLAPADLDTLPVNAVEAHIVECFHHVEQDLTEKFPRDASGATGSTAVVAVIRSTDLWIAWVGDRSVFLWYLCICIISTKLRIPFQRRFVFGRSPPA